MHLFEIQLFNLVLMEAVADCGHYLKYSMQKLFQMSVGLIFVILIIENIVKYVIPSID